MKPLRALLALTILVGSAALPASAEDGQGTISGVVTNEAGAPLADICVWVERGWDYYYGSSTVTDASGAYTMQVDPDGYRVYFGDCSASPSYLSEWFDDVQSRWDAQVLYVEEHATSVADAALTLGGGISGKVTDTAGRPIRGMCVEATDSDGEVTSSGTDDSGDFTILPLRAGSYAIRFGCTTPMYTYSPAGSTSAFASEAAPGTAEDYITEWYDNASYNNSTLVQVAPGVTTSGINAEMVLGGSISGTLTDANGEPFGGCATAYSDGAGGVAVLAEAYTDEGGFYRLRGLPADTYKVQFADCSGYRYRSEWFDDTRSFDLATPLNVTLGVNVPRIDGSLALWPVPDIAVTGLSVEPVPIRTDAVAVPLGTQRDVIVDLGSLGTADPGWVGLYVYAVMADGKSQRIAERTWDNIAVGDAWSERVRWDARGSVGDARIYAVACTWDDAKASNDWASVDAYALVGGTGFGTSISGSTWGNCNSDPWWGY